jgi:hypothetical protein
VRVFDVTEEGLRAKPHMDALVGGSVDLVMRISGPAANSGAVG